MRETAKNGCYKFTYGGVVFIYDPKTNREVTSWVSSDDVHQCQARGRACAATEEKTSGSGSGTRVAKPIVLNKQEINYSMVQERYFVRERLLADKKKWTSHSVLVVDMSGSMRRDDVNGAKCRSDGVWMSLARDYVKVPLENGTRRQTDLISVIVMRDEAEVLLAMEPTDWCLYNKLVELREWEEMRPSGHGNYMPALDMAQQLLNLNTKGSCALALLFFSDGKPSDSNEDHGARMGSIASKFGRRLSVTCIGMASEDEDEDNETFSTLRGMACEADSFGSVASFGSAALDVDSLSKIISSLVTSLTETKTEMTDLKSGKSMSVRMDIRREKKGAPEDLYLTDDWKVYSGSRYGRSWIWSYQHDDYVELFDFRCLTCNADSRVSTETVDLKEGALLCEGCRSACFCSSQCFLDGHSDHVMGNIANMADCGQMQHAAIENRILRRPVPSYCMAVKKQIFGEGAERIVSKLRYLDEENVFHGPRLVAKESRHILNRAAYKKQERFHATFMRTQALAAQMAKKFNRDIDALMSIRSDRLWTEIVRKLPRVHFLEALVTEVWTEDVAEYYLIESYLDGKYTKFNSNNGYVRGNHDEEKDQGITEKANTNSGIDLAAILSSMQVAANGLGMIEECDESDADADDDEEAMLSVKAKSNPMAFVYRDLKDEHIPQAFSHYSYAKSKKRLMVVDLQGVLDNHSDGTKSYNLTDPVIHKRRHDNGYKWNFGRTDRGDKVSDFSA